MGEPDYALTNSALAEQIADVSSSSSAVGLLQRCVTALGAERGFIISFVCDDVVAIAARFMLACNPVWCQHYLDRDGPQHDPWVGYAAHHSEPALASSLAATTDAARDVVGLARQYGFASAALFPAHSGAGLSRISLLVLGSSQSGYFESGGFARLRACARTVSAEFHDWWLRRIRHELRVRSRFTQEDLDLLRRQQFGHTSKQMALDLDVSHQSINSRYQRMNQRLGVLNRRSALNLARDCGLID